MTAVGRTLVREHVHRINGAPAEVFPLLCPVREADWIDGWAEQCTIVRTASGVAEEGCVFLTANRGRPDVTWTCTRYEPDRLVEYVRVWPGEEVVTLTITVGAEGVDSRVDIRHAAVPLPGADTLAFDDRWSERSMAPWMHQWELSMNHYLATGELLREGQPA